MTEPVRPSSEPDLRRQVGRRVYVRRVWLGLSQQEVADRAEVTRNFVSAIERGAQGLDAYRLWSLAGALDGTLTWLLAGPDELLTTPTPGSPAHPEIPAHE
jgi:transcriptional regulator with XRE-family HTH domain